MGGIIIIPLNFWSSIRKSDINLRKELLNKEILDELVKQGTIPTREEFNKRDILYQNTKPAIQNYLLEGANINLHKMLAIYLHPINFFGFKQRETREILILAEEFTEFVQNVTVT